MLSWVDGQPQAYVALADRGLAYGDGLFETMRVVDAKVRFFELHLKRLRDGCQRLAIDLDIEQVRSEIERFSAQLGDGVAKLIVTRGVGERGYAYPAITAPHRLLMASATAHYPQEHTQCGVELFSCQTRLSEQPRLAGLKHLNRLEQVLARNEWQDKRFAEGLMQDQQGRVIEGVFSNLFFVRHGLLCTPQLTRCGVAGVMRAVIIEAAQDMGLTVRIADLTKQDLQAADEVFVCNSQYGIWPVRQCAESRWSVGELTRKLQSLVLAALD